jgi:hypothetical protein
MLSVIMLSVIMLSVVMLNVIMLNVVAPKKWLPVNNKPGYISAVLMGLFHLVKTLFVARNLWLILFSKI